MAGDAWSKNEKLRALQQSYIAQLPDKLAQIQAYWEQVLRTTENDTPFEELYRGVHSLAGSAGTFSFMRLSQLARETEKQLKQWQSNQQEAPLIQAIDNLLAQLHASAAEGPEEKSEPKAEVKSNAAAPDTQNAERVVYLMNDDPTFAEEVASQLRHFNYQTNIFSDTAQLQQALVANRPAAVLLDVHLKARAWAGTEFARQCEPLRQHDVPVIYISACNEWQTRLAVVRAGGRAFLSKPVDFTALIEHLDHLTHRHAQDPYRVLIVEDTELLARHYASVLEDAGMQTQVLTDPMLLLDKLPEFRPELILMDLYMPNCSGVEAAQIIRQESSYDSVPIVYLSTENALSRQLSAMGYGGDDFLQKPIQNEHLVASVSIRAQRFRTLNSLMARDSLTGLLNHITLKQNLESAVAQAVRNNRPLSFVMLDIDHFKSVNDTYGHPMGDKVIKSLARMLTDRLRKSDLIGRYGGEEFALVLPDTEPHNAVNVVNELREHFARILHIDNGAEFNTTFSAGIAHTPPHTDIDSLIRSADEALYAAKRGGRNRVVVHGK